MSQKTKQPDEGGRPSKTIQDISEGEATEATEKTIDSRGSSENIKNE